MPTIEGELWSTAAGTASNISYSIMFNTEFHDSRLEFIVTVAELQALGLQAGDKIIEIRFYVSQLPGRAIANARIALKHTTDTVLTTTWQAYSTFTEVYNNASLTVSTTGWLSLILPTPFTWNGTSNLVIHQSKDAAGWTTGGQTQQRSIGTNRAAYYRDDSTAIFPFDSTTATRTTYAPRTYLVADRGGTTVNGSANLLAQASLSASGKREVKGSLSLVGQGAWNVTGKRIANGNTSITGQGFFDVIGKREVRTSTQLLSQGKLEVSGKREINGIATLLAAASLIANGKKEVKASATLLARSDLTASGKREINGQVHLIGQGLYNVTVGNISIITGSVDLRATGKIIAESVRIVSGSAVLKGNGDLLADGKRIVESVANMKGSSNLSASGQRIVVARADLVANGLLTIVVGEPVVGVIRVKGSRDLHVYIVGSCALNMHIKASRDLVDRVLASRKITSHVLASRELVKRVEGGINQVEEVNLTLKRGDSKYLYFDSKDSLEGANVAKLFIYQRHQTVALHELVGAIEGDSVKVKLTDEFTETLSGSYDYSTVIWDALEDKSTLTKGMITFV